MKTTLAFRKALPVDAGLLGELNHQLIRDEGHRNPMTVPELQHRMLEWLTTEYSAVILEDETEVLAYALYREQPELVYLRQLFVQRHLRRQGHGRRLVETLRRDFWPADKRLTVEVLTANQPAVEFWKSVGFREYSLALEMVPHAA